MVAAYRDKSGRDAEIEALMQAETWLSAQEALELGLADRIEQPVRMAAHFDLSRFRNTPPQLAAALTSSDPQEDAMSDPKKASPRKSGSDESTTPQVKQAVDQQFARWVMLHVQSNPLPICTRPRVLIKGKRT